MALTSLAARLPTLPLILAGPILRRTERTGVTVFVALREATKVTLCVYSAATADGKGQGKVAEGTHSTVRLGENLHAVAVTAKPTGEPLRWGTLYCYDLFFGAHGNDAEALDESGTNLFSPGVLAPTGATAEAAQKVILYPPPAPRLPSFPLPPEDLNKLRIVHGSCRKAHGPGRDVLPSLDRMIERVVNQAIERPQQLFLTGDQIYADDVPDALLALLTDAGNILAAPPRKLPQFGADEPAEVTALIASDTPKWARPGQRLQFVRDHAGFSSEEARSHLLSLNEFYAQYLFAWSDVVWPAQLPVREDIYPASRSDLDKNKHFDEEIDLVNAFRDALPAIRRALAHIPTYTMFDDHEVTDDWFISLQKCKDMLEKLVGYHVIQNGLLAYAIFQGWGNNPAQFETGPGKEFLDELVKLDANPASWTRTKLAEYVGPPTWSAVAQQNKLPHGPKALDWHYSVRGENHEVVVLDTRTWRSYPDGMSGSPALLSREGFERQLPLPSQTEWTAPPGADGVTFVVAPAPVIDVTWVENTKGFASRLTPGLFLTVDAENWGYSRLAFETLLSRIFRRRSRVVVLSGDVHYGYSAHVSYWARQPFGGALAESRRDGVLAQLTSSGFRNQWVGAHTPVVGRTLHTQGYYLLRESLPAPVDWAGWNSAPVIYEFGGRRDPVFGNPPVAPVSAATKVSEQPHWRYRVSFILAERAPVPASRVLMVPISWSREKANAVFLEALHAFQDYSREYGAGKEIVAKNNLGEVTLEWGAGEKKSVTHKLWWRLVDDLDASPFTEYVIPLSLEPRPDDLPIGP